MAKSKFEGGQIFERFSYFQKVPKVPFLAIFALFENFAKIYQVILNAQFWEELTFGGIEICF